MNITVKSEDEKTAYSIHNPTLKCTAFHTGKTYTFYTLSDSIRPHVQVTLFFDRKELETLRDNITTALEAHDEDEALNTATV